MNLKLQNHKALMIICCTKVGFFSTLISLLYIITNNHFIHYNTTASVGLIH